jgi:hypothetical protein
MTATTTPTEVPAEWVAWAAEVNATNARNAAAIAASDYRRRVVLRNGNREVILTLAPADCGTTWEVNGCGFEHAGRGNTNVGDVRSRFFPNLDDAKAYANGWAGNLAAKGYRITR